METAGHILTFVGKAMLWVWGAIVAIGVAYWIYYSKVGKYKDAKNEIFEYVKSYKRRCTGNNRFEVTVSSLQDAFREYDIFTINRVWLELVHERVIEQDPQDRTWCIR